MKQYKTHEDDAKLSKLLHEWKVDASLPPRFQEQVWRRIEHAESTPSLWDSFTRWMASAFARPTLAVAYVAVLLLLGVTTGLLQAHDKSAQAEARWRTAYVQSIDPYQMPGH